MREAVTRGLDRPMIWGAGTYRRRPDGGADTFNTALLTSASGDVLGSYDKIELLLFGERIPLANTFPRSAAGSPAARRSRPARAWRLSGSGR
jgi:apolipoprotein N-acyltransferase